MAVSSLPYNRSEPSAFQVREREQVAFLDEKFNSLRGLRSRFEGRHSWMSEKKGLVSANANLLDVSGKLRNKGVAFSPSGVVFNFGLSFDADDDEIKEFSEINARKCERILPGEEFPALAVKTLLEMCCIDTGFMVSKRNKKTGEIRHNGWEARVCCEIWWRRAMRKVCARKAEQVCREQGFTSRRSGCYVSDFTYGRWLNAQRRNQKVLEGMVATNDDGQEFTLSELSDLGISNPENRRGELMVRMRGFEEWAEADSSEWVPMFYTITCPSKYHVFSGGRRNDKYSGFTPREGQEYLCGVWARIRAEAARKKIKYFGFRVAEPHHDGCPHWHMLIFVSARQSGLFTGIGRSHALAEDGDEAGASEHRFEAVEINPEKGTAAGYIAKYVAKNIDGFAVGDDWEAGQSASITAGRVRAWASVWGVRQFQQVGGPPVTVYRELRRAANNPEKLPSVQPDQLKLNLDSADAGNWSEFTKNMGGAVCPRKDRPVRIEYTDKDKKTFELQRGRYGDVVRRILGVIGREFLVVTRFRDWVMSRKNKMERSLSEVRQVANWLIPYSFLSFFKSPRQKPNKWFLLGAPPACPLDLCQ